MIRVNNTIRCNAIIDFVDGWKKYTTVDLHFNENVGWQPPPTLKVEIHAPLTYLIPSKTKIPEQSVYVVTAYLKSFSSNKPVIYEIMKI